MTAMTRRCYLHVGSPKTGTTFLQGVLWDGRAELARQGVVLPLERRDHYALSVVLRDRVDPEVDGDRVTGVLDRLTAELATTDCDALISHELLAAVPPAGVTALRERLADREVHVVVTARDWLRQLPAGWQQTVQQRGRADFETFVDRVRRLPDSTFRAHHDVAAVARRWGAGLPPERVHVVTVPPAGADPTILLHRFCSVIGVDPTALGTRVRGSNPSLGHEQAELLRLVNRALGDRLPNPRRGYSRTVKYWFAQQVLAPLPGTRTTVPAAARGWVCDEVEAQIEAIRTAGYDVVGDLADLRPAHAAQPDADGPPDSEAVLDVAVEGLAAALTQRAEDLSTIDDLRRQLRRTRRRLRRAEERGSTPGPPSPGAGGPPALGLVRRARRLLERRAGG